MLKGILIVVDGSPAGEAAIVLGLRWAARSGAVVCGLGVVDEPEFRRGEAVPLGAGFYKRHKDEHLVEEEREKISELLVAFAGRCREAGVPHSAIEDVAVPYEAILSEAQRFDLVVLGREVRLRLESGDEDDDTVRLVVKNSPRPVVVVPETAPIGAPVLVAYDGSLQAARTLQAFAALVLARGTDLHVLCAGRDRDEATRWTGVAADYLKLRGVEPSVHPVVSDDPVADVIAEKARQLGAGLIVMGAYGQPVLREFFVGSVTRDLLEKSSVPLFLSH